MRFLSVLVVLVSFLLSSNVEAQVLCAAKTGAIALRSACKKREKVVNLASVGTTAPAGSASLSDGHYVMDANGARVGEYIFTFGQVTIKVNGDYYSIGPISASGVSGGGAVYYLQSNCLGQAYIQKYNSESSIVITQSNLAGANIAYLKGSQLYVMTPNDIALNETNVAPVSFRYAGICSMMNPSDRPLIPLGAGTLIYDFSVNPTPWTIQ